MLTRVIQYCSIVSIMPRDFILFFPNEQRGGGRRCAARLFVFVLFFLCSAEHERDWPPCRVVVFFGLATNTVLYAECEKQQLLTQCYYHREPV